jgi:hypothetical protein
VITGRTPYIIAIEALAAGQDDASGLRDPGPQAGRRRRLRAATGTRPEPESMTKEQIATTVTAISDLMQALRYATTEDKAEIYPGLKTGTRHSISAVRPTSVGGVSDL